MLLNSLVVLERIIITHFILLGEIYLNITKFMWDLNIHSNLLNSSVQKYAILKKKKTSIFNSLLTTTNLLVSSY